MLENIPTGLAQMHWLFTGGGGGGGDGMGLGILFKSLSEIFINHKLLIRLFPKDEWSVEIDHVLTDHPYKYKNKTNYSYKMHKKIVYLIICPCLNTGKQVDHLSK